MNEFVNDPSYFETNEMDEILTEVSRRAYVLFPRKELICIMRKLREDEEEEVNRNTTRTMKFISKYSQAHDKVILVIISIDFDSLEIIEMIRATEKRMCFDVKKHAHPIENFESFLDIFLSKSYLETRDSNGLVHRTEDFLQLATSNTAFFGQIDKIFGLLDSENQDQVLTGLKQVTQFCKHKSTSSTYHIPHLPLSISLLSLILHTDCESIVDFSNRYTIIFSQDSKIREEVIQTMLTLTSTCPKANESLIGELINHIRSFDKNTILYSLIAILLQNDSFHNMFCLKGGFTLLLNQLYNAAHSESSDTNGKINLMKKPEEIEDVSDNIKLNHHKHLKYLCLTASSKNIISYIFYSAGRGTVLRRTGTIKNIQRFVTIIKKTNNVDLNPLSLFNPKKINKCKDPLPSTPETSTDIKPNASNDIPVSTHIKSKIKVITSRSKFLVDSDPNLTIIITSHILLAVSQTLKVKRDGYNLYATAKELSPLGYIVEKSQLLPHCVYCEGFIEYANKNDEQVSFISSARSFDDHPVEENNVIDSGKSSTKDSSSAKKTDTGTITSSNSKSNPTTVTETPIFIPPLALELPDDPIQTDFYGLQQNYQKITLYGQTATTTTKTCLINDIAYEAPLSYSPYLICENPYYVLFDLINSNEITENGICRKLIYDILLNYKKEVISTRKQLPSNYLYGKNEQNPEQVVIKTSQCSDVFIISFCHQIDRYCKAISKQLDASNPQGESAYNDCCPVQFQFQGLDKKIELSFRKNVKHITLLFHLLSEYCQNLYSCLSVNDLNPLINLFINNYHVLLDIMYLCLPCCHGNCKDCEFSDIFYFIPAFSLLQYPFLCCFGLAITAQVVELISSVKTISCIGVSIITTIIDFYSWTDIESCDYIQKYIISILNYLILYFQCTAAATYHYLEYNQTRIESKYEELKPLIIDQYCILFNLCSLPTKHIIKLGDLIIGFLNLLYECLSLDISLRTSSKDLCSIINTLLSTYLTLYYQTSQSEVSTRICQKILCIINKIISYKNDITKKILLDKNILSALIKEISLLTDIPILIHSSDLIDSVINKEPANINTNPLSLPFSNTSSNSADKAILLLGLNKKIFKNCELHAELLTSIFLLLVDAEHHCLDKNYSKMFIFDNHDTDFLAILSEHLNNTDTVPIIQQLANNIMNESYDYYVLLRLLCPSLFHIEPFTNKNKVAEGRYGCVFTYDLVISSDYGIINPVIVKILSSRSVNSRNALYTIYSEVAVLNYLKGNHEVTQILDYGVNNNNYWIVTENCLCSLKDILDNKGDTLGNNLRLQIFYRILYCIKFLHSKKIIHGDLKLSNIFARNYHFNETSSICLGDFGSCMHFDTEKQCVGTECIRSPEMFKEKLDIISETTDIWSLGCLFYELMTNDFLFIIDTGGVNYNAILNPNPPIIPEDKNKKLNNPLYSKFIEYLCNPDPVKRPKIEEVIKYFMDNIMKDLKPELPISNEYAENEARKSHPGVGSGVGLSLCHGTNFGVTQFNV